jgi:hypothetical protein
MAESKQTASATVEANKPKQSKNYNLPVDIFENILRWIDDYVLQLVAVPVLAIGFADAVKNHLQHLSHTQSLLIAIAAAAFLAAKSPHRK